MTPRIFDSAVSAPDPGTLLDHSPLYYVSGSMLLVTLSIPSCTGVSAVKARGEDLLEEGTFVDPPPLSFGIVSDEAGPDRHRVTLRLRFQNQGRGDSYPMEVVIGTSNPSRTGPNEAALAFTLVMVKTIGGPLSMTIAQADLHNAFVQEIWRAYGTAGSLTEDAEHRTYDPEYTSPFEIRNDGIHFNWRVRAQFPDDCDGDRQASISGRITLRVQPAPFSGIEATWAEGPTEHFSSFSPGFLDVISLDSCLIVGDWDVGGILSGRLIARTREWVAEVVRSQIIEPLGLRLPSGEGRIRLRDATLETLPGEVRLTIYPDDGLLAAAGLRLDRVAVDLPYHGLGSGSPVDRGFVLKSGDNVHMMASGRAGPCTSDQYLPWPECVRLAATGPAGVINRESIPLIDASLPGGGPLVGERSEALDGMTSLQRTPDELAFPERNAGGIVARLVRSGGAQRQWIGAGPIGLQVDTPRAWLSFGVNDRYSPQIAPYPWGSGSFQLTVFWLP